MVAAARLLQALPRAESLISGLFEFQTCLRKTISAVLADLDVALVHDKLVTILDDTEQVWPHHSRNLIKV